MTISTTDGRIRLNGRTNPNKIARMAGFLYLLLIPLGVLGIIYIPATLYISGDIATTIDNILANEVLFRIGIVAALLIQLVNLAVVLYLYQLLRPVNENIARLMVIFIIVAMPIAMLNELTNAAVLVLLHNPEPSQTLVSLFLELHEYGIQIAGVLWGLWLFPMGYLAFKSNYIPKIIGILLMIGCVGYLADTIVFIMFPELGIVFSEYTFIGEIVLPLWLLVRGVNIKQWHKQTFPLETA